MADILEALYFELQIRKPSQVKVEAEFMLLEYQNNVKKIQYCLLITFGKSEFTKVRIISFPLKTKVYVHRVQRPTIPKV